MISTTIFPGRYIQGYDAIKRLGSEIARFGKSAFIICDKFIYDNFLPNFRQEIEYKVNSTFEIFDEDECSDEEIERLAFAARKIEADIIVGIGGGKTIDTAKVVANDIKISMISVPTLASSDTPCNAISMIYTEQGEFKRYALLPKNPDVVVVDTKIIAKAPVRFLVAGMGNALATWFEVESCKKEYAGNMTGDIGSIAAYALADLCYKTLLEYGVLAKMACEANAVIPALEKVVESIILLSSVGFESGGLAAAHAINNGLTRLKETRKFYHGEKIAFATLASLFLTDKPREIINEVYSFCESVGLPTTLDEIRFIDSNEENLNKVAVAACLERETIHNEPIPVTPEMVVIALKAADAEGKRRKKLANK